MSLFCLVVFVILHVLMDINRTMKVTFANVRLLDITKIWVLAIRVMHIVILALDQVQMIVMIVMMVTTYKIQQIFVRYTVLLESIIGQVYKFSNATNVMQVVMSVRIVQQLVLHVSSFQQIGFCMITNAYLSVLLAMKTIRLRSYVTYVH